MRARFDVDACADCLDDARAFMPEDGRAPGRRGPVDRVEVAVTNAAGVDATCPPSIAAERRSVCRMQLISRFKVQSTATKASVLCTSVFYPNLDTTDATPLCGYGIYPKLTLNQKFQALNIYGLWVKLAKSSLRSFNLCTKHLS